VPTTSKETPRYIYLLKYSYTYESKEPPTTSNVSNKNTTIEEANTELVIKEDSGKYS
jgi:hypothetical protein